MAVRTNFASETGLASILAGCLLVGASVGVAAQDPGTDLQAATVMGTMTETITGESVGEVVDELQQDQQTRSGSVEMSDPRLSGAVSFEGVMSRYQPVGSTGTAEVFVSAVTIENDGGAWGGTATGCSGCNDLGWDTSYMELSGSGAYEGLSAILFAKQVGWGAPSEAYGVIFPGAVPEAASQ